MKEINGPELNDLWARRIKDGGADFVCFVDVSMFPEKLTGGCGCAVLFGKALPKEYIRALAEGLRPEENALHNLKRKMDALVPENRSRAGGGRVPERRSGAKRDAAAQIGRRAGGAGVYREEYSSCNPRLRLRAVPRESPHRRPVCHGQLSPARAAVRRLPRLRGGLPRRRPERNGVEP